MPGRRLGAVVKGNTTISRAWPRAVLSPFLCMSAAGLTRALLLRAAVGAEEMVQTKDFVNYKVIMEMSGMVWLWL